jgi:hypothetical protein
VDEVADGIYRISTYLADVVVSHGVTINQFLVLADEPLLFHTGFRTTFPETVSAVARLVPLERLRWLSFGHVEADECGAMNHYLAAALRPLQHVGQLAPSRALRTHDRFPCHGMSQHTGVNDRSARQSIRPSSDGDRKAALSRAPISRTRSSPDTTPSYHARLPLGTWMWSGPGSCWLAGQGPTIVMRPSPPRGYCAAVTMPPSGPSM